MRFLYHLVAPGDPCLDDSGPLAPASLSSEGFVHCSYADRVHESGSLYFAGKAPWAMRIDPRRVDAPTVDASTPRGPMPHVHGPVPRDAVREVFRLAERAPHALPDAVTGTRFVVLGFRGMTLLDLVGVTDPLSRIRSMGVDPSSSVEVATLDADFADWGARFGAASVRPALEGADVVVLAGGPDAQRLAGEAEVVDYLRSFPANRLVASVCSGALLLGAAGRLRGLRATTHASVLDRLATFGASPDASARVVVVGNVVTGGGVTCGIDVGLALVARLYGDEARARIATQMQWPL